MHASPQSASACSPARWRSASSAAESTVALHIQPTHMKNALLTAATVGELPGRPARAATPSSSTSRLPESSVVTALFAASVPVAVHPQSFVSAPCSGVNHGALAFGFAGPAQSSSSPASHSR